MKLTAMVSSPWRNVFRNSGGIFDLEEPKKEIERLQRETNRPDFWDDPQQAQVTLKKVSALEKELRMWEELRTSHEEVEVHLELINEAGRDNAPDEALEALSIYSSALDFAESHHLLNGPDDHKDAILTIHPGA
ncbi:MAG: PCRF domain-containing protein, partial [Candidatus Marinimicrobia bacterium]|nr:PCRF domain-containing protein [Candidatus Neomarinimicrobiota bacterium]